MKFILLFGAQAVGKMTVGQELAKITGLKLFHNHMTIDLVSPFFNYSTETGKKLVYLFREQIFEEAAKSDLEGLIFTYVRWFDYKDDCDYVDKVCDIFRAKHVPIYFVELEADVNERIARNKSPHRLDQKFLKRDIERSEKDLKKSVEEHRLTSLPGEITEKNYIRIDNTHLSPEEVAKMIKEKFTL